MNKRYLISCILFAFFITALYNIFVYKNTYYSEQQLKVGQIAEKDIIAPFDFEINKTKKQLYLEKEQLKNSLHPVYIVSDEVHFKVIKRLNDIFIPLINEPTIKDTIILKATFKKHDIKISNISAQYFLKIDHRKELYRELLTHIDHVYTKGIYNEEKSETIYLFEDNEFRVVNLDTLISLRLAKEMILQKIMDPNIKSAVNDILSGILIPNVIYDAKKFNDLLDLKFSELPKSEGSVSKNEIIVRKNSRVTEEDLNKINSLVSRYIDKSMRTNPWQTFAINLSFFLYYFILSFMMFEFYKNFIIGNLANKYHFIPLLAGLFINTMLAILNNQILGLQTILIPYSMTILSSAILIDVPFAMFYNLLSFASIYPFVNWETFSPLVLVLSTASTLLLMNQLKDKHQYFSIWLYLITSQALLLIIFSLFKFDSLLIIISNFGYALVSSSLSILFMIIIVPIIEKKWNLATKKELLELLDFNHPLLKKLATEAVGTYYHSLIVGNLVERAAEAIGANALLARVGSYYHDVGKIVNPEIFTENNPESANIHYNLSPSESAAVIKNHVTEGVKLAKKYKIPSEVVNIILQHHGTGYIKYFLDKAEKINLLIDIDKYKYEGPKPNTKEAALVMIADIVESVAKSWSDINNEDIKKILNDTILRLVKEGQFEDCSITMKDLTLVKISMIPILESIYRKRQQYPEQDNDSE